MLNQIARRLTEKLPDQNARKLLLMLDEFPALGRLDFFENALAFMAGYGVRAFLIAQSLNQIENAYGSSHSILDNCHVRIIFATNDDRTAKRFSDALGTKTELRSQKNYTGHRLAPWLSHMMVSRQETQRQLMTPGEIMQMSDREEIVMISGQPPIKCNKLRYFGDRNFVGRVTDPPIAPKQCQAQTRTVPNASPSGVTTHRVKEESGSKELSRTLKQSQKLAFERTQEEPQLDLEDGPDAQADQSLDNVRKAAILDRDDPNRLPNM